MTIHACLVKEMKVPKEYMRNFHSNKSCVKMHKLLEYGVLLSKSVTLINQKDILLSKCIDDFVCIFLSYGKREDL